MILGSIGLLFLGFALVVAEIFFPSLGVLSLMAGAALIGAVVAGFHVTTGFGISILVIAIFGVPVALFVAFKLFPRTPLGRRMVALGSQWKKEERAAVEHAAARFVGDVGRAYSPLRPTGIAMFNGERLDVVTRGEHIEPNTPVRAIRFVANRLVVERINQEEPASVTKEETHS